MSAREAAEGHLRRGGELSGAPAHSQAAGLLGIGWALLDVAEAIREGHQPTHMQMFPEDSDEDDPSLDG